MNPVAYWRDWWHGLNTFERAVAVAIGVGVATILTILLVTPSIAAEAIAPAGSRDTITLALIVAVPTLVTGLTTGFALPIIFRRMDAKVKHQERMEDREDRAEAARLLVAQNAATSAKVIEAANAAKIVAKQADETARRLAIQQNEQAERDEEARALLAENTAKVAASTEAARLAAAKLAETSDAIHTLVNNNLTLAEKDKLDLAQKILVRAMKVVALEAIVDKPSVDSLADVTSAKARIAELELVLADRTRQATKVEQQQKDQRDPRRDEKMPIVAGERAADALEKSARADERAANAMTEKK